jgi:hypothetical protein
MAYSFALVGLLMFAIQQQDTPPFFNSSRTPLSVISPWLLHESSSAIKHGIRRLTVYQPWGGSVLVVFDKSRSQLHASTNLLTSSWIMRHLNVSGGWSQFIDSLAAWLSTYLRYFGLRMRL